MAPPRKHDTDRILDATRDLVLAGGPRAASVAAIARASGAPPGTLYHRFGNRDGVLAAVWVRALERFQARVLAAADARSDPLERGAAMARAAIEFATAPDPGSAPDARLLLALRRRDLLDAAPDDTLERRIAEVNRPLEDRIRAVAEGLHGRADPRSVAAVVRAVVLLPGGVIRQYGRGQRPPPWLAEDVAADARALLARNCRGPGAS